jgi:hypothetical protein
MSGNNIVAAAIEAAEDICDPLEGLVEKTKINPGAPFTPEALERLATLKKDDRAAFEMIRAQLKDAGCRVTALDDALGEEDGDKGGRAPKQADILINLAQSAELFHAPDGTGFADLNINGHRETWPIRGKGFRRWLARLFFQATEGAPSSEALQSALNVIEAKAHFDAPERVVHVRVGGVDSRLYLDLGDETWRAVEIDATGWRIVDNPPVRFRRAAGMQALPMPVSGGSIETLRSFLNVKTDADFVLAVTWVLACLRNRGPYPVMVLSGEQGSAKSTFSAILRALLDPNTAPLREVAETVRIVRVPCRFGGSRPYFICPGVVHGITCGRRVVKLHGTGRYFLCRHCYRLAYASQSEGTRDRAIRRARKIRESLGGDPNITAPFPKKPPRMRRSKYERRKNKAFDAEMAADDAFALEARRLSARIDKSKKYREFWR